MAHEGCHSNARILGLVHDATRLSLNGVIVRGERSLAASLDDQLTRPDRIVILPACSNAIYHERAAFFLYRVPGDAADTQNI
jgi:hypothetical protein